MERSNNMKHMKTFLVQKEWDNPDRGIVYAGTQNPQPIIQIQKEIEESKWIIHNLKELEIKPVRLKKIVVGFNSISKANSFCYQMNQECGNCPRRAALHTKYEVIAPPVYIRIENETT